MRARAVDEPHRVATPLELLFDLCFVVAVAQAALPLHHAISEDHVRDGVISYLMVFFAIWWAWMNFTWFASAYDTDDNVYRITTLVQIAGALVLAAGVKPAFEDSDYAAITLGYVVMRLALVAQWLRASSNDPPRRAVALRYAAGITIVQVLWLARLALPESWATPVFLVLVVGELLVPAIAERAPGGPTTYHPHHITERYGLFTIIVLGESVAAATVAVRTGLDEGDHRAELISVAVAGLIIVFALWWVYFDRSAHDLLTSLRASLVWGYGHYVIFAATAAIGAGAGCRGRPRDPPFARLPYGRRLRGRRAGRAVPRRRMVPARAAHADRTACGRVPARCGPGADRAARAGTDSRDRRPGGRSGRPHHRPQPRPSPGT